MVKQRCFRWQLSGPNALRFCQLVQDKALVKRRQLNVVVDDYPSENIWTLERRSRRAFKHAVELREWCCNRLQFFKVAPDYEIPKGAKRPMSYWAAVSDGDGSLGIELKERADGTFTGRQRHTIKQKFKPLLEAAREEFGGTLHFLEATGAWELELRKEEEATRFEARTRPHSICKIEQHNAIKQFEAGGRKQAVQFFQQLRMFHGGNARLV